MSKRAVRKNIICFCFRFCVTWTKGFLCCPCSSTNVCYDRDLNKSTKSDYPSSLTCKASGTKTPGFKPDCNLRNMHFQGHFDNRGRYSDRYKDGQFSSKRWGGHNYWPVAWPVTKGSNTTAPHPALPNRACVNVARFTVFLAPICSEPL